MRALGFPVAHVLSETVHQNWGQAEVFKGN